MGTTYFYLKPLVLLLFIDKPSDLLSIGIPSDLLLAEDKSTESCQRKTKIKKKLIHESISIEKTSLSGWYLLIQYYMTTKQWLNPKEEACQHFQATWGLYWSTYLSTQDKSLSLLSKYFFSCFPKQTVIDCLRLLVFFSKTKQNILSQSYSGKGFVWLFINLPLKSPHW